MPPHVHRAQDGAHLRHNACRPAPSAVAAAHQAADAKVLWAFRFRRPHSGCLRRARAALAALTALVSHVALAALAARAHAAAAAAAAVAAVVVVVVVLPCNVDL